MACQILFVILIIAFVVFILYNYQQNTEHFTLFTANPVNFVSADCLNNAPRHVKFNKSGGMEYISHYPPTRKESCSLFKCPDYIDETVTLGNNNFCWSCEK